jgi:phosphonate transport system permease protein
MQEMIQREATAGIEPASHLRRPSLFNRQILWAGLALGLIVWSLAQAGLFRQDVVNEGGWTLVWRFFRAALQPDLSPDFLALTLKATITTLAYAVCGTALSLLLGLVGGVLSSEVWWQSVFRSRGASGFQGRPYWLATRTLLAVPRAIHEIIWGLFFVNILGLDPLTAILAIAIPYGAIVAKVFSEILDNTPRQPLLALLNSGVSPLKAICYSLGPQAFPDLLSYSFYRFECSIRSAAVLGIIGAGGLGYEIFLSLQSLRYEQMWTLFFALFLLNGAADYWSAILRHRLGGSSRLDLNLRHLGQNSLSAQPDPATAQGDMVVRVSLVLVILLLPFSFWYIQADFGKLWSPRTLQLLAGVMRESFPPRFDGLDLSVLFNLSSQTLAMSVLAMAVAGLGGALCSFPAAHNFLRPGGLLDAGGHDRKRRLFSWAVLLLTRGLLLVFRSIPAPIWALLMLFVLFPGILPGAMALALHTLGILGRLMAEVIENLDERPLRVLKAQGASGPQVFLYGVLPLTLARFVAYTFYRWEVSIRETVIVGLVGAGGLGRLLTEQLSSFDYRGVVTTLICFLVLTFLVDLISASAQRTIR